MNMTVQSCGNSLLGNTRFLCQGYAVNLRIIHSALNQTLMGCAFLAVHLKLAHTLLLQFKIRDVDLVLPDR